MQDLLYVSYDSKEDGKGLCVGRPHSDGSHEILKVLVGDRAEDMYLAITGQRATVRNLDTLRTMSADELAIFLEDLENYMNPNHQWRSDLMPILPFEDWREWLERRAIYETNKR